MRLPDGKTIDADDLAKALRMTADMMIKTDGDRDEGNESGLKVFQVQAAFRLMVLAADKLEAMSPANQLAQFGKQRS